MKSTQHTPGPWRIEPEEHAAVILCDAFVVADVYYEAGVMAGASTKEEALANARLIATSPDLLSELKLIEVQLDINVNLTDQEMIAVMLRRVRAVIAKATESPSVSSVSSVVNHLQQPT